MIPLARCALDDALSETLARRTAELAAQGADTARARQAWSGATSHRQAIRGHLAAMAPGIERCMYCGDSLGTSIDHFEPLKDAPLRTFDWLNHLLACSMCNSNEKRDRFPRALDGSPLLIDPSSDDPYEHLRLVLKTGRYRPVSDKGSVTIDVFGLNRRDLVAGREDALVRTEVMILARHKALSAGRLARAEEIGRSLVRHPFVDVLYSLLRDSSAPGVLFALQEETVEALKDPAIRDWPAVAPR